MWTKTRISLIAVTIIALMLLIWNNYSENESSVTGIGKRENPDGIHPRILEAYDSQKHLRLAALNKVTVEHSWYTLYNALVPEVFCKNLIRIGRVLDGGKWICNPTSMLDFPECTIYSLGIKNDPSFDEDFQKFLNKKCKLRSFDKGSQSDATLKRIKNANGVFIKALIAGTTNQSNDQYTFKDLLEKFGDKRVDILKIDIEGAEYDISDELISVEICQILIEIHADNSLKTLSLLRKISKSGYYLFSYEINGIYHHLSEYSFIHESCLSDYNVKTIYGKYLT